MRYQDEDTQLLRLLLYRLERVSVDSYWAHRASGVRGSLLRALDTLESGSSPDPVHLQSLFQQSFTILGAAARERLR